MQGIKQNYIRVLISVLFTVGIFANRGGLITAHAANTMGPGTTYSIIVNNTNSRISINGKSYSAYKVFDMTYGGTYDENTKSWSAYSYTIKSNDWAFNTISTGDTVNKDSDGVITNSKYGLTLTPNGEDGDNTIYVVTSSSESMDNAEVRQLADDLTPIINDSSDGPTAAATETASGESVTLNVTSSGAGYYAVYGQASTTDGNKTLTAALGLTSTDNTRTVEPKADAPTLDKKITGVKEQSASDYSTDNILDKGSDNKGTIARAEDRSLVSFELSSVVPDLTGYSNYTFTITDTLSSGLEYIDDRSSNPTRPTIKSVTIGDNTITSGYSAVYDTNNSSKKTMKVTIDYNTLKSAQTGQQIKISYDAYFYAREHNYEYNTANLTYSNNPSVSSSTETTPDKKNYIVCFSADLMKTIKGTQIGLPDARFQFYKGNSPEGKVWLRMSGGVVWYDYADDYGSNGPGWWDTQGGGNLSFKASGLDAGTYNWVERIAPKGYNKLTGPATFTVNMTLATEGENKGKVVVTAESSTGNQIKITNGIIDLNSPQNDNAPVVTTYIENEAGSVLPSTGGIGTTVFYIAGVAIIIAAVGMMMVRRKKNA